MYLSWWLLADALVAGLAVGIFAVGLCVAVALVMLGFSTGYEALLQARAKYEPGDSARRGETRAGQRS